MVTSTVEILKNFTIFSKLVDQLSAQRMSDRVSMCSFTLLWMVVIESNDVLVMLESLAARAAIAMKLWQELHLSSQAKSNSWFWVPTIRTKC